MKQKILFPKRIFIALVSLLVLSIICFGIIILQTNNSHQEVSQYGLVQHVAIVTQADGDVVSPGPITEESWFIPVVASCVALFALCIILGLGIGIPIAKKKEKKLLAERRENEALMQKIQEVTEEEVPVEQEQKTEELNAAETHTESVQEDVATTPTVTLNPTPVPGGIVPQQNPMLPNYALNQQMPGGLNRQPQLAPGMMQQPNFNPAVRTPQQGFNPAMNRQTAGSPAGFRPQQQGFAGVNPQQAMMQNRMAPNFNNRPQAFAGAQQQHQMPQQQMPIQQQRLQQMMPKNVAGQQLRPQQQQQGQPAPFAGPGGYRPNPAAPMPGQQQRPQQFRPNNLPPR